MAQALSDKTVIYVIGLGYVGLPLAEAFSKSFHVTGFDIDREKVKKLTKSNKDIKTLSFTDNPAGMSEADFIILCVPTPLTESREPDLSAVESAARITGQNMKRGSVVILESTVYPGVTEEIVLPILEKESGLKAGRQFKLGYSPERVNPGDKDHTIDKTAKVVAGMDDETTELIARLYGKVAPSVFKARDIRTAEASKAVENIQRDLNIALMNELSLVFEKMGLNTRAVLEAAATKWNFHRYTPGLVGGHCIPVVPQYFAYKARQLGYDPQIIRAGRAVNDFMPVHVAELTRNALKTVGKTIKGSKILVMGLAYKDNVPDAQDSPVRETVAELKKSGAVVYGYDPLLDNIPQKFGVRVVKSLDELPKVDAVIVSVAHEAFRKTTLAQLKALQTPKPVLIDIRQIFDRTEAEKQGFYYQVL